MSRTARQQIDFDARVSKAAQEFWKSREWFGMYMRGFVPSEYSFPEYYSLRDAINDKHYPRTPALSQSWRWRLARFIAGI